MARTVLVEPTGRTSIPLPDVVDRALLNKFGERWQKDPRARCPTCKKGRLEESKGIDWHVESLDYNDRAARRRLLKQRRKNRPLAVGEEKPPEPSVYRCTDPKCGSRVRFHPATKTSDKVD